MSLGATTSAPARACETAVRAISSTLESLSTRALRVDQAAVAVVGVLAQADVGHDEQLGVRLLDRARGELDDALVVVGAGALGVLAVGDPEQQHGGQAERLRGARLLDGRGDAQAIDARQRGDRLAAGLGLHEQRQHEVGGVQARLAHEVAQDRGRAQPPKACGGEGHARQGSSPGALFGLDRGLGLGQAALLGLDVGLRAEVQHRVVGRSRCPAAASSGRTSSGRRGPGRSARGRRRACRRRPWDGCRASAWSCRRSGRRARPWRRRGPTRPADLRRATRCLISLMRYCCGQKRLSSGVRSAGSASATQR